jgi:hypothetical protein
MNPYTIIGALLIWGVTFVAGYGYGHRAGVDRTISGQASADQVRRDTIEAAQQGAANAIAQIKVVNTTIRGKTETIVLEDVRYRDCKHDALGLRAVNAALTGREAEPVGSSGLPAADAPKR